MTPTTYSRTLIALTVALTLAGCGGGAGTSKTATQSPSTTPGGPTAPTKPTGPAPGDVVGLVFDGPVSRATVFCDINKDQVWNDNEAKALTDNNGRFNITCPVGNTLVVLADGTATDTVTRADMRGVLKGYVQESTKGFTQINAVTSLAAELIHAGEAVSTVENKIREYFTIPSSVSVFGSHPASNAALLNAVLSTQSSLLAATGELAFVDRAASASDNPSINAIHATLTKKYARSIYTSTGTATTHLASAVAASVDDIRTHAQVDSQVKGRLTSHSRQIVAMASNAGKIALDRHEQQFKITDRMVENLDLTGTLPAAIATRIKDASTWTSRFGDPVNMHMNTLTLPTESEYMKTVGGFLQLNDGTYIDPRFTESGRFAFAVDINDAMSSETSKVIEFNPSGDHLNSGFTSPLVYDIFTNPYSGFSILVFKEHSSPDDLIGTNMVFGNIRGDKRSGVAVIQIPVPEGVELGYDAGRPSEGLRVRLTPRANSANMPQRGDRYVIVYHDKEATDKHSITFVNNGLTGKGVKSFVTPVHVW